jgi:hypothetical protein
VDADVVEVDGDVDVVEVDADVDVVEVDGDVGVVEVDGDADDVEVDGDVGVVEVDGDADVVEVDGDVGVVEVDGEMIKSTGIDCGVLVASVAVTAMAVEWVPASAPEMSAVTVNESEALPATVPESVESESHGAVVLTFHFNGPFPELEMLTVCGVGFLPPRMAERVRLVVLRLIVGCEPCASLEATAGSVGELPSLHPMSRKMQRTISRRPIDLIQRELHVKHSIAF